MSKNFDLLTSVKQDQELFEVHEHVPESTTATGVADRVGGMAREEVIKLVQRIFFASEGEAARRAVLFCGVDHRDGASWMCAQAALALAEHSSNRICVVDANFSCPSLHTHLGTTNGKGLVEAVRQIGPIRSFLEPSTVSNLWVLPAGSPQERGGLLMSDRFRERLAELRAKFDYLIFDVSPVRRSNDAAILGSLLDGAVLVVRAGSTRRDSTRDAKESLEKAQVNLLGSVLNRRSFPIPGPLYRWL